MKTGLALVDLLEQYGVDTVFGIPGTHSLELYRGLAASGINHILPRHEQGAGFMADGYARVSGKPGVCFVITGPGVTNITTPIGQAMSDSVPMLVISPVNDLDPQGQHLGRLHEIGDQAAVTRPLTVFSETVSDGEEIPRLLARAFDCFYSRRPGPVHISIPLSVLRGEVQGPWVAEVVSASNDPDNLLIEQAVQKIMSARDPVIVAGGGCRHFGELAVALAEKIPCPVITTVAGRGVIPAGHPLSPGAQLASPQCRDLLSSADLAVFVGTELAEPDHWTDGLTLPEEQIWINLDESLLELRGAGVQICADARVVLPRLSSALQAPGNDDVGVAYQRCQVARNRHGENFSVKEAKHWRVLTELKKSLPDTVTVFSDMTQLAYTALDNMPLDYSNSWHHPNGYGTLGYALPAAIGARIADPELPLLVIVGDAGFQYTLPELAVAGQHDFPLVVLLWQNEGLQQIADDMEGAGIDPIAVKQDDPDFVAIAEEYGWRARKVAGLFELGAAIEAAFDDKGPVLLELCEQDI